MVVDTGDSGGNDSHGDMGHSSIAQAVAQTQRGDNDAQHWDSEVLNHAFVHVLDKDKVDASATNNFAVLMIGNGIHDARLLLTVSEDDFKSMGHDIDFKMFRTLQALNKMCNKQVSDTMSEDNKNMWFLNLGKQMIMHHMML